ncbi:MAG TPA: hypothetical protein VHB25_19240 [Gemmatimonadaceae bacterium]|nr:hypothetical protein [Gemmatimonadaceae bacterium]
MRRGALSSRDRRVLAVGTIAIVVMLGGGRGLPRVRQWQGERVAEALALLDRRTAVARAARTLPALRDSLRVRNARLAVLDSSLLHASTAYAAAAALASALDDIADASAVKVGAMQLRADSAQSNGMAHVYVRLTGVADVIGLGDLLRATDDGQMMLRLVEITVTQADPAAAEAKTEALRIDVLVEGLARLTRGGDL